MEKTKKRKLFCALASAVLAVSAAITAYAIWGNSLSVKGHVSANGNWSVKVTDAQVELSSAGAELDTAKPTYDVIVYPIIVKYVSANDNYIYNIDDTRPKTVSVTADEFAEYSEYVFIKSASANFYVSGKNPNGRYSFKVKTNGNFSAYPVFPQKAQDGGAADGTLVGEAIAWCCEGTLTPAEGEIVTLTYAAANDYFANNTEQPSVEINGDGAEFAPVHFSLPGAWANYVVTVTNEGSVNTNLSDYMVEATELSDIFTVSLPGDFGSEVLAPGESCTFNVVVKVNAEGDFEAETKPFAISLVYAQDEVNEAPSAGHSH